MVAHMTKDGSQVPDLSPTSLFLTWAPENFLVIPQFTSVYIQWCCWEPGITFTRITWRQAYTSYPKTLSSSGGISRAFSFVWLVAPSTWLCHYFFRAPGSLWFFCYLAFESLCPISCLLPKTPYSLSLGMKSFWMCHSGYVFIFQGEF